MKQIMVAAGIQIDALIGSYEKGNAGMRQVFRNSRRKSINLGIEVTG